MIGTSGIHADALTLAYAGLFKQRQDGDRKTDARFSFPHRF